MARQQYIRKTFGAAKGSISINGMNSKELEAELAKAQEGEGRILFQADILHGMLTVPARD